MLFNVSGDDWGLEARPPAYQLIKKGEQIPFDVAGTRTIHVDHRDLDSVEEAKNEIIDQIISIEKDPSKIETPISVSLDLQLLRQSENPEQRSLADLLSEISQIRTFIARIENVILIPKASLKDELLHILRESKILKTGESKKLIRELAELSDELYKLLVEDKPKPISYRTDAAHLVKMMRHILADLLRYEVY